MIIATTNSTQRELIPAGSHVARCFSMIHLGTALEEYLGEKKLMTKIKITFELPDEKRIFKQGEEEKPFVISKDFTLSMHEKASLRIALEAWRGKGFIDEEASSFDITRLLTIPCMLNIIHAKTKAGRDYAKIAGFSPLPKSIKCPTQINPTFEFNFTDKFDLDLINKMPTFIQDRIKISMEYKAIITPQEHDLTPTQEQDNEKNDLPF